MEHVVSIIAYSGNLPSDVGSVRLTYNGTSNPEPPKKLYALLVGVTDYANYKTNLYFPARDAESLDEVLRRQKGVKGAIYDDVETKIIDYPTRNNVLDGLYWLQRVVTENDTSIILLSG